MTRTEASGSFVTGGARGLGRAIAKRLAQRGDVVFVADVDGEAAARTAAELADRGSRVHPVSLDVRDTDAIGEAVAAGANVIVSGSGIFGTPDYGKTIALMKQNFRKAVGAKA